MNKLSIYGLSVAIAVGFTACDNYEEPNPQPQTNPQGSVIEASQVLVNSAITGDVYSLEAIDAEGQSITLASFSAPDLNGVYSYDVVAEISGNGFAKSAQLPVTVEQVSAADGTATYTVSTTPASFQQVYYATVSKGPKAKAVDVRFEMYTLSNGNAGAQKARIGGPDTYFGPYSITVLPFPSELVIEDNYYLVGTACDWTVSQAIKLQHDPNVSPYDDPVFSAKFDVTEGWWWKIIPESTYVTGDWASGANSQFGVEINGDDSPAGLLVAATADAEPNAGCLNLTGPYLLTINMEEMTYEFSFALEQLYTPGNSNGWSQIASQIVTTTDYVNYSGACHLNGEFKFTTQLDWNGTNYGAAAEDGMLSTDGGAGNLNAPADGLYWVNINIASLTYSIAQINTLGVIGDATPNGWDASTNLTPSADFLQWTGTIHFAGTGEFKLRANDAWDINFGGAVDNLVFNAGNMPTPGEGDYNVTVDFSQVPYQVILTK